MAGVKKSQRYARIATPFPRINRYYKVYADENLMSKFVANYRMQMNRSPNYWCFEAMSRLRLPFAAPSEGTGDLA